MFQIQQTWRLEALGCSNPPQAPALHKQEHFLIHPSGIWGSFETEFLSPTPQAEAWGCLFLENCALLNSLNILMHGKPHCNRLWTAFTLRLVTTFDYGEGWEERRTSCAAKHCCGWPQGRDLWAAGEEGAVEITLSTTMAVPSSRSMSSHEHLQQGTVLRFSGKIISMFNISFSFFNFSFFI